jgi:hypothetical protein
MIYTNDLYKCLVANKYWPNYSVQQFKLTAALRLTIAQNQFYKCSLTALSFLARPQHTLKLREKQ